MSDTIRYRIEFDVIDEPSDVRDDADKLIKDLATAKVMVFSCSKVRTKHEDDMEWHAPRGVIGERT